MKRGVHALLLGLCLLLTQAALALADPLGDGLVAYATGDYATALRLFRPLADQGHAAAQNRLGFMYVKGRGVPQDDAEAARCIASPLTKGFPETRLSNKWSPP